MEYKNITLKKYQIIKHIINKYAENHEDVKPNIEYHKDSQILEISGISKPISFNTESIGIIPKGAYEVVGQVIRSKTDDGHVDINGMNLYDSAQRIFNIANDNRQAVFDFITENSHSSYCSCCGTNRDRNRLFYIRRVDTSDKMYQVGSSCITEYFDTSYFDLMKEISNVLENDGKVSNYQFSDYNLVDYLALYCIFIKTEGNIKTCCKKVTDTLDCCDDVTETRYADEFKVQKAINLDKIIAIAKFYMMYPNYAREDNMFAIKTMQSMADMLSGNIDVDPYYSKSNCANIAKMYISLLSDYASDYKRFAKDLFKYNAYVVENTLVDIWNEYNQTSCKLNFELIKHTFNITILNAKSPILKNIKVIILLDDEGNMIDGDTAKSELINLASRLNKAAAIRTQKNNVIDILNDYKRECISRYSNFNPAIVIKQTETTIRFFDYTDEPLVLGIADDIEQSKLQLSAFINMIYNRQQLNTAYKEFLKKYRGKALMAYTQSKQLNLQFSCDYIEKQLSAHWPEGKSLSNVSSYVDVSGKNIVIQYSKSASSLKMPVNTIGIISGADYDISLRIRTFVAKELGLPMPKVTKVRTSKTDEDIVKLRPKKNVTRLFNSAGASAKNLVMIRKVNVLNDISSNTIGVSAADIGRILFRIENGNAVYHDDVYHGRIVLDGHNVTDQKRFDKKTLSNAVHALEYLIYLSDENSNLLCNREVINTKSGINYTYKYDITCGTCVGSLQFRISQVGEKHVLKYGPKFVVEKIINNDKVVCMININFSENCWKNIQMGLLKLDDLQRGPNVLHGQKNPNIISGSMWINNGESQKLDNTIFTEITGISI